MSGIPKKPPGGPHPYPPARWAQEILDALGTEQGQSRPYATLAPIVEAIQALARAEDAAIARAHQCRLDTDGQYHCSCISVADAIERTHEHQGGHGSDDLKSSGSSRPGHSEIVRSRAGSTPADAHSEEVMPPERRDGRESTNPAIAVPVAAAAPVAAAPDAAPLSRPYKTCYYCGTTSEKVEAAGVWHCPNPDCSGPAAAVHNHGLDPSCKERVVGGRLRGECLDKATPSTEPVLGTCSKGTRKGIHRKWGPHERQFNCINWTPTTTPPREPEPAACGTRDVSLFEPRPPHPWCKDCDPPRSPLRPAQEVARALAREFMSWCDEDKIVDDLVPLITADRRALVDLIKAALPGLLAQATETAKTRGWHVAVEECERKIDALVGGEDRAARADKAERAADGGRE